MLKNKIKMKRKIAGLVLTFSLLSAMQVLANPYSGYRLPMAKGNNYTAHHKKQNNKQCITNRVTNIEKTNSANMWACDVKRNMVSDKINFRKGSGYNDIDFRSREHLYRGQNVCMGMENGEWSTKTAFVAGDVNFQ